MNLHTKRQDAKGGNCRGLSGMQSNPADENTIDESIQRKIEGAIAELWRWREGSGGGLGLRGGRIADDLDPVSELHPLDQFWQLVLAVDPAPTLLGALNKLEDHSERSLVRQTT